MQTLTQVTRRHFLHFNIQRRISKSLSPQRICPNRFIKSCPTLYTTTNMTSSNVHTSLQQPEGAASKTTQEPLPVKPFSDMPGPRGLYNIPYIGFIFHLKPFTNFSIGDIDKFLFKMHKRFGPIFRIQTDVSSVVVTDPKDISIVLQNQGKFPFRPNFEIFDVYYRRTGLRPGLTAVQGEDWWKLREPMQRVALKPKNFSQYLTLMEDVTDNFVKMLLSGYLKNRDLDLVLKAFAAESTGTLYFNKRLGFLDDNPTQESKDFLQSIYHLFDVFYKSQLGSIGYKFYRSKEYIKLESAQNTVSKIVTTHVMQAKQELARLGSENVQNSMVMSLFKDGVADQDVSLILESLLSTSIDSSAAGIQLALYILSKNPDIQEKVRKDIFDVLSGTIDNNTSSNSENRNINNSNKDDHSDRYLLENIPQHISKEALNKMRYLKAFFKEMHRFSPLVPVGMVRILPVDVVLGGYNVPAGTQIYTCHHQSSLDESIFKNPYEFQPERWLRASNSADFSTDSKRPHFNDSRRNWAVVPFGVGVRSCPGKRIFEHEISLLIAKLLTKARIGLEPGCERVEFEYHLFLKAKKSIPFTFTPLDQK